jgi:hypothetical protein
MSTNDEKTGFERDALKALSTVASDPMASAAARTRAAAAILAYLSERPPAKSRAASAKPAPERSPAELQDELAALRRAKVQALK